MALEPIANEDATILRFGPAAALLDSGSKSQASHAFEVIRNDILSGRHLPDQKLKIQDLASELRVSAGAVREALSRLVSEQLAVSRDQRGFAVAPLSIPDLEDITDLRCEIEELALRRSVERGGVEWEVGILAAAHRLRAVSLTGPDLKFNLDWAIAHTAFHTALVAGCESRRLLALHAQLYEQSERYRRLAGLYHIDRDIAEEHQAIVDLALARDGDGLVQAQIEHIKTTTRLIIAAVPSRY